MRHIHEKSITEFLLPVSSLPQSLVESAFVSASCFLKGGECDGRQNKIVLKDNLLLLAAKQGTDHQFTHGLLLQEGICFKRITKNAEAKDQPRQLIGFRLIGPNAHYADFLLPFEGFVRIWLQQLARLINEVGFADQFETLRKLGKGSTACVYEVRRRSDQQLFAAKVVLKAYLAQRQERAQALEQEVAILRAMEHNNIIKLEGVFESEQAVYLVFERLETGNLLEHINAQRGLSLSETKRVMRGIAEGLAYLHRFSIAHRDIKLENILLRRNGDAVEPVIADFGLAVVVEEEPYLFYRCGTPGYVAPEIIRMKENRPVRVACDVYSAGAILHLLLTNSYLFPGNSSQEVYRLNCEAKPVLSGEKYEGVDSAGLLLLRRMLAVRVGERISAEEMLEDEFLECEEPGDGLECEKVVSPAVTEAGDLAI